MNFYIPPNWISATEAQLQGVLRNTQYEGDGYCNGVAFKHRHNLKHFAIMLDEGGFMADPAVFDAEEKK